MYVGGTDDPRSLLDQVLSNAFDEHLAGRASHIHVTLHADASVSVSDDGGGAEAATIERALTSIHHSATLDGHRPHAHLSEWGHYGLGLFVVAALCEHFEIESTHALGTLRWSLLRGVPTGPIAVTDRREPLGTRVRFRADRDVFRSVELPRVTTIERLERLVDLAPKLRITLTDEAYELGQPKRGLARRLRVPPLIELDHTVEPTHVRLALGWRSDWDRETKPRVESFVNYLPTTEGGTHVSGLLDALKDVDAVLRPARPMRERLEACLAIVTPDVQFGAPTRDKLVAPAVRGVIRSVVSRELTRYLETHPEARERILARRKQS
jgi:DNA gyrase subunit B